jgi:hypothetical protein
MNMQTLNEAVAAFRQQLHAALAGLEQNQTGGLRRWHADRVTLSLEVVLGDDGTLRVPSEGNESGKGSRRHRVSIEFQLAGPTDAERSGKGRTSVEAGPMGPAELAHAPLAPGLRETVQAREQWAMLFGPPGFDSSARAAVFCEMLQGLRPELVTELPASLMASAKSIKDEELRRARHLILGLVQSGPLKSPERASVLLQELLESRSVPALIELVETNWKTGETWAK